MKRTGKLFLSVVVSLIVLVAFSSIVFAQRPPLPDPPPRGTIEGPPPVRDVRSFTGGVLFVTMPQPNWTEPQNQDLGTISCTDLDIVYQRIVPSNWGLSLQGPISDKELQGILEGIDAFRPPSQVTLTYLMDGVAGWKRQWTLTGIEYTHTRYRILVVRQAVPAQNELIGYVDVHIPNALLVDMTEVKHPDPPPMPDTSIPKAPPGVKQKYTPKPVKPEAPKVKITVPTESTATKLFNLVPQPPEKGLGPIFSYGKVTVYSGSGVAAVGFVRPGETVGFKLPPGSYEVKAAVRLLGIPFNLDAGAATADVPIQLYVTIMEITILWYVLLALGAGLAVIIVWWAISAFSRMLRIRAKGKTKDYIPPFKP